MRSASSVQLLIGVISFSQPGRLKLRNLLRSLLVRDPRVALRFVMAEDESATAADRDDGDMLLFRVSNVSRRRLGKLLLQNAFFLHALAAKVPFVARLDDDALVNASAVMDDLELTRHRAHVAYGPFRNWYQWMPAEMTATCWTRGPRLYLRVRGRHVAGNTSVEEATHPCYNRRVTPAFPFAAGPFMAFSRPLLALLAPRLRLDEPYILHTRPHTPFPFPRSPALTYPNESAHVSNGGFFEDGARTRST